MVVGNEAGLTQCFSNLLGNAVKFVKPGETPEICVGADRRDGWARIWVEDKGIGVSKDMLPRVFEMFSRGRKGYEGTGIGLALVRKVAQRMGGRAGVESEEGKGSRFWVELKVGKTSPQAKSAAQGSQEGPKAGTVLYVEDEESDAMFMEMAFAKGGARAGATVGQGRPSGDGLLVGGGQVRGPGGVSAAGCGLAGPESAGGARVRGAEVDAEPSGFCGDAGGGVFVVNERGRPGKVKGTGGKMSL